MRSLLNQPYPAKNNVNQRWRICIIFSGFVVIFLYIFRPFGLNELPQGLLALSLGYGLITFTIMALLNVVVIEWLKFYFREDRWTLGRELFWTAVNIFFIGIANAIYTTFALHWNLKLSTIATFEMYTLSIGIIPAGVGILINYSIKNTRYTQGASALTEEIKHTPHAPHPGNRLTFDSENNNESLTIETDQLLYISAADNYVEVNYLENELPAKQLLRNTLKQIEEKYPGHPGLFRCHKSYLVNLNNVSRVSGNAQGYKLHLQGIEPPIPVSRSLNAVIKEKILNSEK